MSKIIKLSNGNQFEVQAAQFVGRLLDAEGNPIDSGNSLVPIEITETTTLPEAEIAAVFTTGGGE